MSDPILSAALQAATIDAAKLRVAFESSDTSPVLLVAYYTLPSGAGRVAIRPVLTFDRFEQAARLLSESVKEDGRDPEGTLCVTVYTPKIEYISGPTIPHV